jgi:hypothetical protein
MGCVLGIDAALDPRTIRATLVAADRDPPKQIRASPSFEDFVLGIQLT